MRRSTYDVVVLTREHSLDAGGLNRSWDGRNRSLRTLGSQKPSSVAFSDVLAVRTGGRRQAADLSGGSDDRVSAPPARSLSRTQGRFPAAAGGLSDTKSWCRGPLGVPQGFKIGDYSGSKKGPKEL